MHIHVTLSLFACVCASVCGCANVHWHETRHMCCLTSRSRLCICTFVLLSCLAQRQGARVFCILTCIAQYTMKEGRSAATHTVRHGAYFIKRHSRDFVWRMYSSRITHEWYTVQDISTDIYIVQYDLNTSWLHILYGISVTYRSLAWL